MMNCDAREHPSAALLRLVFGYQISQAIHVAATLGLADLLANGPRYIDDLAAASGADASALYRLLRALASVGVFYEGDSQQFALTPLSDCLRTDAPEPVGPLAEFIGSPAHWQAHAGLLHSIRTGENAFQHTHGVDVWTYRSTHPEDGIVFERATSANSRRQADAVLDVYDFEGFGCVVDIGGGQGVFLAAMLVRYPAMRGVVFDQRHVASRAGGVLEAAGVADRCRVASGSFFDAVPAGGDAYVLKSILHDWDDEAAVAILRVCRRAMQLNARLIVLERVIAPPNEGPFAKFSDLQMLVSPGGRERTQDEFADIFTAAGFKLTGMLCTASELSVIEGIPVK